jgi:hypothetical protein
MAIKLLDVPGDKILPAERQGREQDFIMINHPVQLLTKPAPGAAPAGFSQRYDRQFRA